MSNHPNHPLASGQIVASGDALSVELVEPHEHPGVIMIHWPDHATVVQPARFNAVAAEICDCWLPPEPSAGLVMMIMISTWQLHWLALARISRSTSTRSAPSHGRSFPSAPA